jgi:hypothetical protein
MATEATNLTDAQTILSTLFVPGNKDRLGAFRKDFEKILLFMSDKTAFEKGLLELSKKLWDLYRQKDEDAKNKFSSSLIQYAVLCGFPAQPVTILAAGDEEYPTYLQKGILIKDEMDLLHGEYAHSLQWLAAAAVGSDLNLGNSVAALYQALGGDGLMSSINVWRYEKAQKANNMGKVHLRAYLVDSFPMKMVGSLTEHTNNYSLFTDNYRCPQNLTSYLLNLPSGNHFLARYMQWRYLKRGFMSKSSDGSPVTVSTGATIKNWADSRYNKNPDYTKLASGAGWVKNVPVAPVPPTQTCAPSQLPLDKLTQVTFHGKSAMVHGAWEHV